MEFISRVIPHFLMNVSLEKGFSGQRPSGTTVTKIRDPSNLPNRNIRFVVRFRKIEFLLMDVVDVFLPKAFREVEIDTHGEPH